MIKRLIKVKQKDVTHLSPYVTMNLITETQHNMFCFFKATLEQKKKKKKNCRDDPRFVFNFSFHYPVRNFILKYEYSSSPIYKLHAIFGRKVVAIF